MKKVLLTLTIGLALVLSACGGGSSKNESAGESSASAEDIVKKNCTGCHGVDLGGANGPSLQHVGSKHSEAEIENIINNGQGGMPKGLINEKDAKKVAAWLAKKK
ncbi:cytochrome c551 [Priestia megaterium]|uniref:cytochrome c551 n=1 Tax=Priestia megaterium TaxID=1404 RepID=UPI000BF50EC2|nr:cytochrome c [Priestia megaterium]PFK75973.1 cytochrome C551 [Priestia megaterium]